MATEDSTAAARTANEAQIRAYVGVGEGDPLPGHAWPGGYPLSYVTAAGDELCSDCAADALRHDDDPPVAVASYGNTEDYPEADVRCANCNRVICEGESS